MSTQPTPPDSAQTRSDESSLVVVGSSAGGIEALSKLVSTLPAGFPAPIILAQHLDPTQPSHLGDILARFSQLPVRTVTDRAPLEAGTIYVIPPDRNVEVSDHMLRMQVDGPGKRPMPSINLLFSSAASAFGERLIAVILTGTGSDGASGAYQVKAAGGLVIIENPATAAYPALPASLAPTTVDFVADLERIGPLLLEILTNVEMPLEPILGVRGATAQEGAAPPTGAVEQDHRSLRQLLRAVQAHTSIDFSNYKLPTILRRLHRRMFATNMPDLAAYQEYLDSHPEEYPQLISSFLIKVTEFFRDPDVFAALKQQVLPDLIGEARKRGNVLRLWSAGCATGEEAYSLAILVAELLGAELKQFNVQIFATDVDEDAIEFARHGIYPAAALAGVSPERQAKYFRKLDGNYQIVESIRGLVIFGLHDLGVGAPFPRIDLVLCRNVLIYFMRELQLRALQGFAFSLRNGGYLQLGTAESINPATEYFTQASRTLRLYRRIGERVLFPTPTAESLKALAGGVPPHQGVRLSSASASARARARAGARASDAFSGKQQLSAQDLVLQETRNTHERLGLVLLGLPIGVVLVDRHYDVQIINAHAMRLLDIFTEPIGEDLIHLARGISSEELKKAIDEAFRGKLWPLRPLAPLHQQPGTSSTTSAESLALVEGVIMVETLLGERRSLQFTCYPYIGLPPAATTTQDQQDIPAQEDIPVGTPSTATADTSSGGASDDVEANAQVPPQARDVPLVLIMIRDVTDVMRQQEQIARASAHQNEISAAEQAHARGELEAATERLQSEVARLRAEITRQSDINRSLLEGNQRLANANLALRTANEQLQLSEEEAEASSEEVKTLNEELQSTNEELVTLNEELEATVEELHASNDELQARTRSLQDLAAKLEEKELSGPE